MGVSHPIEDPEVFRNELQNRKIRYTRHFEDERLPYRQNVDKELIESHIRNPEELIEFVFEADDHEREKYQTLFDKSSKYYLKIVLSMEKDEIYIVTTHIINKAKREKSQIIG